MINLIFQGFLILLFAFVIGLPVGDLLARWLRCWFRRPRPETKRVLAMIAGAIPESAAQPAPPEPVPPLAYPVSVFGQTTISRPVPTDHETSR